MDEIWNERVRLEHR